MRLIFDARSLRLYPVAKDGFTGATETILKVVAHGLAERGHHVHVIAPDQEHDEQRGPTEWWWGPDAFPTNADALICWHNLEGITTAQFHAPILICATNAIDPWCGPDHGLIPMVDGWVTLSETHSKLLAKVRPIDPEKCYSNYLGVFPDQYDRPYVKLPGRMLWSSDPQRGLWHMLDIFDHVKKHVPHASLMVTYDFERQFEHHRWQATAMAELLWDCKRRIEAEPSIISMGALSRRDLQSAQLQTQVFAYPCDPPTIGSELFCLSALEAAAAGAALVLADTEALPEVYGEVATILPVPGTFMANVSEPRRYDAQDWAEVIVELMQDDERCAEASRSASEFAATMTWQATVKRWEKILEQLALKALGNQVQELVGANA